MLSVDCSDSSSDDANDYAPSDEDERPKSITHALLERSQGLSDQLTKTMVTLTKTKEKLSVLEKTHHSLKIDYDALGLHLEEVAARHDRKRRYLRQWLTFSTIESLLLFFLLWRTFT